MRVLFLLVASTALAAPQFTALCLFGSAHFSTLERNTTFRQRVLCDVYDELADSTAYQHSSSVFNVCHGRIVIQ